MSYEYTGCGIPNIFLENGFVRKQTPYGPSVSIDNLPGLHQAIGRYLAEIHRSLTGAEFRFLRNELNFSQKRFGQLFNVQDQTVANWEKGKHALPDWADKVMRVLYLEKLGQRNKNLLALLDFLTELDTQEVERVTFKESDSDWAISNAA